LAGIEAGGTKFVWGCGTGPDDLESVEIPTTTPAETIERVAAYFTAQGALNAIGIGSFGPIAPASGKILSTPKIAWRNFDFAGAVRRALGGIAVAFDTDVNAAAIGEHRWGAAQGLDTFLYITVGTGIGGGGLSNGRPMHGHTHPEMGHIRIPRAPHDPFPGNCPSHGDCLEGLAAAPAIEVRWGQPAHLLPPGHQAWKLEAEYLSLAIVNWTCTLSPQRIILGGGVMSRPELHPAICARVVSLLNDYIDPPEIVAPHLGAKAGILGAIAMARDLAG